MLTHYEIIINYDKEYGEVIGYTADRFMNDSTDIISYAICLDLMEEQDRKCVSLARAVSEYEYEYIKQYEKSEL